MHEIIQHPSIHSLYSHLISLLIPCEHRFNVPAIDVVRLLLPDVIVFIASLFALIVNIVTVVKLRPPSSGTAQGGGESGSNGASIENEDEEHTEIEAQHVDSERGTYMYVHSLPLQL